MRNAPLPHGGNVLHYSKKFGIPPEKIIDFSASVNPLGPPKKSLAAMNRAFAELNRYPDPDSLELTAKIAAVHGLKDGQILIGNGSTEFIYLLPRALGVKKALVLSPSFSDYERASELSGAKVVRLPLLEENNFSPDMKSLSRELKKCGLLFLCNPNNPTGTLMPKDELLSLLKEASKAGTVVCIDEAFIEYVPGASLLKEAVKLGAVVLRNFTKFYGMPGIRIGYAAGDRKLIAKMKAVREPWTVNNLAQAAALAALGDGEYAEKDARPERGGAGLSVPLALRDRLASAVFVYGELPSGQDTESENQLFIPHRPPCRKRPAWCATALLSQVLDSASYV